VCVCVCVYNNHLDMTEMPHKTMTNLRMYCNSFPIVLNINHSFSNFEETLTHLNQMSCKPYMCVCGVCVCVCGVCGVVVVVVVAAAVVFDSSLTTEATRPR
jgi:hypothetical protein